MMSPERTLTPAELTDQGKHHYQAEAFECAAEAFAAAAAGYRAQGLDLEGAEAANNSSVAWLMAGEAQRAWEAAKGTAEVFAAGGDIRRRAMALGNLAAALESLDKLEEAESAYVEAADLFAEAGEDEMRAVVMQSLSQIQLRTGRHLEALASMQTGVGGVNKPSLTQRILKWLLRWPMKLLNRG